ncbi:tRNA(Met) cytidine acetyltransferase [Saccharolobus solfataricus]|nr:tRNA(Met) cytidine acetyltransferase TmcA [Saccharolobus solfataricus]AKA75064.1 tRNA(Met) cytidine acetyltransferase [Saccharolobus solfataricus]AKA77758.1 tRNA(Met) cytidine acetyltransferase [Saccharolobus solfataricus]AKA79085.1 tRNA(Met) cytidine acetyltransferase [Saccharolobus solfataricus]AZF69515.1 tRNA(Met) cytidine acetyltransferase [Saccharolobus solfataricus]AZF72135.1 tRNA(Met) cytidine acetyltransferase [Saccharolobus solfataricus]
MFENYFMDAVKGYYRHLAIIESQDPLEKINSLIDDYLKVNKKPRVIYGFHPWLDNSKDRMKELKKRFENFLDIDYSNSEKYLGQSADLVILDAMDDFRPNYIARFVDMTKGGGIAIIYSDNILEGKLYKKSLTRYGVVKDLFEARFIELAKRYRGIIFFQGNDRITFTPYSSNETHKPYKKIPKSPKVSMELHELCLSSDQNKVLEESLFIMNLGKRVLVITAARGRGKSASIGLFLSYLMSEGNFGSIIVTSPTYYSSQEIFKFIIRGLEALNVKYKVITSRDGKIMKISTRDSRVKWVSPDLAKNEEGDLIVIDEAAAMGIEFLDYIVRSWDKVILVTTIHGYEGSGKAFLKYVDKLKGKVLLKNIKMDYPIRYAKGDPIEKFLFDVFLLDAEPHEVEYNGKLKIVEVPQEELFRDDDLLKSVYGILVTAHYRNSPDDLMLLGDMAFQKVIVGYSSENPVAVCQVVYEGGLTDKQIWDISNGLKNEGHLIPHRLIKYMRALDFGKLKGWRIMRIAVSPENQGKGIGSRVIEEVIKMAKGVDWIGSSFVADYSVLRFWIKNGFLPVYLSSIKNEELNGYSVIVIKALSERTKEFVVKLSSLLKDKLLRTSHQVYYNLNPQLIVLLLRNTYSERIEGEVPDLYVDKIKAYTEGKVPYNVIAEAAHFLVTKHFLELKADLSIEAEASLVARVLQGKSWYHAGLMLGLSSREVEDNVKQSLGVLLETYT